MVAHEAKSNQAIWRYAISKEISLLNMVGVVFWHWHVATEKMQGEFWKASKEERKNQVQHAKNEYEKEPEPFALKI